MKAAPIRLKRARLPENEEMRGPKLPEDSPAAVGTLRAYMQAYHQWMRERNYSNHTIRNHRCFFGKFLRWCEDRGIVNPRDISSGLIERYQRSLYQHRDPESGEPLSFNGQRVVGMAIHSFFRWMKKRGHLPFNPAADIELPRRERHLPKYSLTTQDVEKILSLPDAEDPIGIRDRAILEVLYSTGIRREEVARLRCDDVDPRGGTLLVRQGKGKRDRLVPIGARAVAWIDRYLLDARPALVASPDPGTLFVMKRYGTAMSPKCIGTVAKQYIDQAKLKKTGSCHLFRHAMAVHLLENGADVKFIQAMLGHQQLASTDAYANLSLRKMKELHTRLHPAGFKKKPTR